MSIRAVAFTASLFLSLGSTAMAQVATGSIVLARTETYPVAARTAGRWLHDRQGNTIGSVRGFTDEGQIAVLMIGSYFEPGSHEVRVPANSLSEVDHQIILRTDLVEALNKDRDNRGRHLVRAGP